MKLSPCIKSKYYQTLTYFGLDQKNEIEEYFINGNNPRGVDRVVPIGSTSLHISLDWDGYDIIKSYYLEGLIDNMY